MNGLRPQNMKYEITFGYDLIVEALQHLAQTITFIGDICRAVNYKPLDDWLGRCSVVEPTVRSLGGSSPKNTFD